MRRQACALVFAAAAFGQAGTQPPPLQVTIADLPIAIGDPESIARIVCGAYRCVDEHGSTIVYDPQTSGQVGGMVFRDHKVSSVWKVWIDTDEPGAVKLSQALFLSLAHLEAEWIAAPQIFIHRYEISRGSKVLADHLKPLEELGRRVNEALRQDLDDPTVSIQTMSAEIGRGKTLELTVIAWDRSEKHLATACIHEVLR